MNHQPCRVAIIGAGYTAKEHLKAFRAVEGVQLAGIFSRTRARAEALAAEFGIAAVFGSLEEMYQATQADVVVVTVNELSMKATALACFRYPWFILLEKPAGLTVAEAQEIADAARALGRADVAVALNRRQYSATRGIVAGLEGRTEPRHIRVLDQENRIAARANGNPEAVVDNWMYANSIHLIDFFRVFSRGTLTAVRNIIPWNPAGSGPVLAVLEYSSGDIGVYECVWETPGPWVVSVNVPGTRWELRPIERLGVQNLGQPATPVEPHEWDVNFKAGFRLQAEKVVAARRGETTDLATLEDSLESMKLVQKIYQLP